jgi:hypothetical protein
MVSSYYLACKSSQQSVYNGPPYIDFCPVPARHGCVLAVPARPDFLKRFRGAKLSCLTSYRRAEKPKMVSTPTSSPIYGLRHRIRG